MRVKLFRRVCRRYGNWVGVHAFYTAQGEWISSSCFSGSLVSAMWFALTGKDLTKIPPFWSFRIEGGHIWKTRWSDEVGTCSAGLYSRVLYFELLQGVDISTGMFYRWFRVGIPNHGCLKLRLQKRMT